VTRDDRIREQFRSWILSADYPCVGAKAAFNSNSHEVHIYSQLLHSTGEVAADLRSFAKSDKPEEYATFIAIFRNSTPSSEPEFEQQLWQQLQRLHEIDDEKWDASVSSDPRDPHFSFSFAGQAFYVIGIHADSSRLARRFPWTTVVFNPHEQFERLRGDGKWKRMQQTIRERDKQLQGSINPMLSDFGERSEAAQYSGRTVDQNWEPPTGKCPFAH
jgi:FPC/CPF motif-containing protein YcgG